MSDDTMLTTRTMHSTLYRSLLETQNKLTENVAWVKSVLDDDLSAITAALARAEAAEAEVVRLRDENAEAWFAFDRQQERADRIAVRVTELEAEVRKCGSAEARNEAL